MNSQHKDHPAAVGREARIGLGLFLIYFLLYAGFLLLNALDASAMQDTVLPLPMRRYLDLHGLNLALVYGMFLILAAIGLGFVYMRRTRSGRRP